MSRVKSFTSGSVDQAVEVLHSIGKATKGADVLDIRSLGTMLHIVNIYYKYPQPSSLLVPLAHCAGNMLCTIKNEASVQPHAVEIRSVMVHCLEAVETVSREVAEDEMTKSEIIRNLTEEFKTMLNNNPRTRHYLLERLFGPLANLINSYQLSATEVSDVAKLLNMMMAGVKRDLRASIFRKNKEAVEAFINRMITCGDYEAQQDILEILVRLSSKEKEDNARAWFDQPTLVAAFMEIGTKQFELECRSFINLLNSIVGDNCSVFTFPCEVIHIGNVKVHKPKSDIVRELFVDCNMGSKSLSFSCVRRPGPLDVENNQLINVICPASLTHTAYLLVMDEKFLQLNLTLKTVIPGLDDSDLEECRSCAMVFKRKHSDLPMLLYSIFGKILQCDPELQTALEQQFTRPNHHGKFKKASDGVILVNTAYQADDSASEDCIELSSDVEVPSEHLESANCHEAPKTHSPPPLLSRDPAECNACYDISDEENSKAEENSRNGPTLDKVKDVKTADNTKKTDEFSSLVQEKKAEEGKPEDTLMLQQTARSPVLKRRLRIRRTRTDIGCLPPNFLSQSTSSASVVESLLRDEKIIKQVDETSGASSKNLQSKAEPVVEENVDVKTTESVEASKLKIVEKPAEKLPCAEKTDQPNSEPEKTKTKTAISKQNTKNVDAKTKEILMTATPKKAEKPVEKLSHLKTKGELNSEPDKVKTTISKQNKKNVDVKTTEPKKAEKTVEELAALEKTDQPNSEPEKTETKTANSKQNKKNVDVKTTTKTTDPKEAEKPVEDLAALEKTDQPKSEPEKAKTKTAISKQNKKNVDVKTTEPKEADNEELSQLEKTDQPNSEPEKAKTKTAISKQNKKNVDVKTTDPKEAEKPVEDLAALGKTDQPKSEPEKAKTKTVISKQNKKNVDVKTTEPKEADHEELSQLEKTDQPNSEPEKEKTKTAISKQNKKNVDTKTTTKTTEPKEAEKPVEENVDVKTTESVEASKLKIVEKPAEKLPCAEKTDQPNSEPEKTKTKAAISKQNTKNVDAKTKEILMTATPKKAEKPIEKLSHLKTKGELNSEPDKVKTTISKQNKKNVDVKTTEPKKAEKTVEELSALEKTDQPNSEPEKAKTKTAISKQNKKNVDVKTTEPKEAEKPVEEWSHLETTDEPEKVQTKTAISKPKQISSAVTSYKTSRVVPPGSKSSALVPFCETIQTSKSPLEAEPASYTEETSNHRLKVAELPGAASANPCLLFEDPVPSKMRLRRRTKNKQKQLQLPHLQFIGDQNDSITPAGSRKRKLFTPTNKLSDSPMPECAKKSRNETKESPTFVKQMNENICTMQINQSMTVKSSLQIAINFSNKDTEDYNYTAHTVFSDTEELDKQDDIMEWSRPKPFKSYGKSVAAPKKRETVKSIPNNSDTTSVANSTDCKPTLNILTSCNQEAIDTTSIAATDATKLDENTKSSRQKQNRESKNVKRQQKQTTKKNNKPTMAQMRCDTDKKDVVQTLHDLWSDDYFESLPDLVIEKPVKPQPLARPPTPKFLKLKPMCYDPIVPDSKKSSVGPVVKKHIQFDQDKPEASSIDFSKNESMLYVDSATEYSSPCIIPDSQHPAETWEDFTCGKTEDKLKKPTDIIAPAEPQPKSGDNNTMRMRGGGNSTVQSSQDSIWGVPSKVHAKRNPPNSKKTGSQVPNSEKSLPINPKSSKESTNSVTEKKSVSANESTWIVEVINDKKKDVSKSKPVSLSLAKTKKTTAHSKKNITASCSQFLDEESWLENSDHALFSDLQHSKIKKSAKSRKTENTKVSKNSKKELAMEENNNAVDKSSMNSKKESAKDRDNTESTKAIRPSKQASTMDRNKTAVDNVKEKKDLYQPKETTKASTKVVVDTNQAKSEELKSLPVKPAAVKATKKTIKNKAKLNSPTIIKADAKLASSSAKKQEANVSSQVVSKATSYSKQEPKTKKKITTKPIDELEYLPCIEEVYEEPETTEKLTYCEDIEIISKSDRKKLKEPLPTKSSTKPPVKQKKVDKETKKIKPLKEIKEDSELDCFINNSAKCDKQAKKVKQVPEKQTKTAGKRKAEPLSSSKRFAKDSNIQKKSTSTALKIIPESSSVETSPSIIEGTPPESISIIETHAPKTREQAKYHASSRLNIRKPSHVAKELAQTTPVCSTDISPVRSERNTSGIAASPAFHSTPKKKKLRSRYPMTSESEEEETPPMVRRKQRRRSLLPSLSAARKMRPVKQQKLSENNPSTSSEDDSATEEPPVKKAALDYLKSSSEDTAEESEDNLQVVLERSASLNSSVMNSGRYFQNVTQLVKKYTEKRFNEAAAARQENLKLVLHKLEEEIEKREEHRAQLEAVAKRQEKMMLYTYNTFVTLNQIMENPPASTKSLTKQATRAQQRPEINLTELLKYDLNKIGEDYQRQELRSSMIDMQSKLHFLLWTWTHSRCSNDARCQSSQEQKNK